MHHSRVIVLRSGPPASRTAPDGRNFCHSGIGTAAKRMQSGYLRNTEANTKMTTMFTNTRFTETRLRWAKWLSSRELQAQSSGFRTLSTHSRKGWLNECPLGNLESPPTMAAREVI